MNQKKQLHRMLDRGVHSHCPHAQPKRRVASITSTADALEQQGHSCVEAYIAQRHCGQPQAGRMPSMETSRVAPAVIFDSNSSLTKIDIPSSAIKRPRIGVNPAEPHTICFLLTPGFALIPYACIIEPLRVANHLSRRELYRWWHATPDGMPVSASNRTVLVPDYPIDAATDIGTVVVFGDGSAARLRDARVCAWLRSLAKARVRIGGVSGGIYVLARTGLLDGYRCTIHWEHYPAFVEAFPSLHVTHALYEIDRDRFTCSGGVAGLDMMLTLIASEHGSALAAAVSEWFVNTRIRPGDEPQRRALAVRYGVDSPRLVAVLARMEETIEEPVTRGDLAALAGVSMRQLERLFRSRLGCSIARYYLDLRLTRARTLLAETTLSVLEVAIACGFASASHFAGVFRKRYGVPPSAARQSQVLARHDRAATPLNRGA